MSISSEIENVAKDAAAAVEHFDAFVAAEVAKAVAAARTEAAAEISALKADVSAAEAKFSELRASVSTLLAKVNPQSPVAAPVSGNSSPA